MLFSLRFWSLDFGDLGEIVPEDCYLIVTWYPYCDAGVDYNPLHLEIDASRGLGATENTLGCLTPGFIKAQQTQLKYTNIPNM